MISVFSRLSLFLCFSLIIVSLPRFPALRVLPDARNESTTTHPFYSLLNVSKGSHAEGMYKLKHYFAKFGYLPHPPEDSAFTNLFDNQLENAVFSYQKNLGLPQTGKIDSQTMEVLVTPRCGVSDHVHTGKLIKTTKHFNLLGQPMRGWVRPPPATLTYAFARKDMVDYLSFPKVQEVLRRSFSRWSSVIPVTFTEIEDYSRADVKIGWYRGDHGDGSPFDGPNGMILAHAIMLEDGHIHFDSDKRFAVDLKKDKTKHVAYLEAVAMHEIGHILGLDHTNVTDAIMFPSIRWRAKKVNLHRDDVEGVDTLYGLDWLVKEDGNIPFPHSGNAIINKKMVTGLVLVNFIFSLLFLL